MDDRWLSALDQQISPLARQLFTNRRAGAPMLSAARSISIEALLLQNPREIACGLRRGAAELIEQGFDIGR